MAALASAYELRSLLRPAQASFRVRFCGLGTVSGDPEIVVREYGKAGERRAHWRGVMLCGRQYACPVCASRRAAERREELAAMLRADLNARWQMATFTLRHHAGEGLRGLTDRLLAAWRRVRATRRVRDIFTRRVNATARGLEVTAGANGWHPHIHLAMQTSEWTPAEQATLAEEWSRALPGRTESDVAIVWSKARFGWQGGLAYIGKLTGELTSVTKKAKRGNSTSWELARAGVTNPASAARWREYVEAMRGRRILELDERAKTLAVVGAQTREARQEWIVPLYREEYRALAACEKREPAILWRVLEAARTAGADPPAAARAEIDRILPQAPHVFPYGRFAA